MLRFYLLPRYIFIEFILCNRNISVLYLVASVSPSFRGREIGLILQLLLRERQC